MDISDIIMGYSDDFQDRVVMTELFEVASKY